jgi:acylphosphatase
MARRYIVEGRVQGVGFRYFAAEAGRREAVGGWVRNLADGRVEAYAEGEPDAVLRFEQRLRTGPPLARVARVDVQDVAPSGAGTFEVLSTAGG